MAATTLDPEWRRMGRTKLKYLTVYATAEEARRLQKAAASERRSLSRFLLVHGLARAEALRAPRLRKST